MSSSPKINPKSKASQPLSTLSPFRYPGGKSWLRREIIAWLGNLPRRPSLFLEPFAGGGSVSLAVAELNLVDRVIMVEKDPEVAAVWKVICGGKGHRLIKRIMGFKVSRKSVLDLLNRPPRDEVDRAFQCLVKNRMSRGGVMAFYAGLLRYGDNGKGLLSRWYPETISQRIERISLLRDRLKFREGDGIEIIRDHLHLRRVAYYIDPPYISEKSRPGVRLYHLSQVDPLLLLRLFKKAQGQFVITYQDSDVIFQCASDHDFWIRRIPMQTSHHLLKQELIITNNKYW